MKQFRIYFKNNELTSLSWCLLVEGSVQEQGAELNERFKHCAQSANDIVFIVPQFWVYETSIDLSKKNAKQLLSAVAYQLEEQLAEDVEELHFAQGKALNNQVPFLIIKHDIMTRLIEFEKNNSLTVATILTEMSLCAEPNQGELNIVQHDQHYLLKLSGIGGNSICLQPQLDFFIQKFESQYSDISINRLEQTDLLCAPIILLDCINLKQKKYSQSHAWQSMAKHFTLPIVLMVLFGMFWMFNQWQANQQLLNNIELIKQQQITLLSKSVKGYSTTSNAKVALIKALQKQQAGQSQSGFIFEFHQFLKAKKVVKSIKLNKVDYRNSQLIIDVSAENLQQLDQLIILMKKDFKVTVSQMDSSKNESLGRFVLEKK